MIKYILITLLLPVVACRSHVVQKEEGEAHYLQIREKGRGCIYIDKVSPRMVLAEVKEGNGDTRFYACKVAFEDSIMLMDKRQTLEKGKYYQYDMEKDWIMVHNGDSLRPVFYQPYPKRTMQLNEGVLLFELPAAITPDTLLYNDSYGYWGQHIILLNK